MKPKDIENLKKQLKLTIKLIENKFRKTNESILIEYLKKYEEALSSIESSSSELEKKRKLTKILNCARGYLEYSSEYNQDFLEEMSKSEKIVRKYINEKN